MNSKSKLRFLIDIFYAAAVAILAFLGIRYAFIWFWPFWAGLGLAYLFRHLARNFHSRSPLVTMITGIAFYCAVVLIFWIVFAVGAGKAAELFGKLPTYLESELLPSLSRFGDRLLTKTERFLPASLIPIGRLIEFVSSAARQLTEELSAWFLAAFSGFIRSLPLFLVGFTFMIVSSFAIAMDYERVTQFLMRQLPPAARPLMLNVKNFLISCLFKLIKAYFWITLITFSELCLGLWALRVEHFWQIAAVTALLDMLPLFGSGAVLIPGGLFAILSKNSALGAGLLILFGVIAVVRNIIEPRIVGDSLDLHPAATLAVMYFGLRAFGFTGMIAAPVAALLIRYLNENGKIRLYRSRD
ncbi:MAG: AI-2E family transporter [Oscillospiraceae bacterium]|nr:AI-2E family transporter [Oscillospiraceae bacterium]MBP1557876.1 AI-2E family transporter [Oscillospiraceae bacterium]